MTKDDQKEFLELLDSQLNAKLDAKLKPMEERLIQTIKSEVKKSRDDTIQEMGDLHDLLMEKLDEKADKSDVQRLERKLDYYAAEHEERIINIEATPIVAHELKKAA